MENNNKCYSQMILNEIESFLQTCNYNALEYSCDQERELEAKIMLATKHYNLHKLSIIPVSSRNICHFQAKRNVILVLN